MNPSQPKRRRPLSYLAILGLSVLLGLGVGLGAALIDEFGGANTQAFRAALLSVGVLIGVVLCIRWWQGADEAVREAHKWAWYWGGSAGIAVVVVLFVLSSWDLITLNIPPYGDGPDGLLLSGSALTLGLMLAGYIIAWAAWWLRHR
ncbi:hypothetical protein [Brevundimonas sp.]